VRVNKWLNELEKGFYGSSLAYDTALKVNHEPQTISSL
jgi:hypothetical protein